MFICKLSVWNWKFQLKTGFQSQDIAGDILIHLINDFALL